MPVDVSSAQNMLGKPEDALYLVILHRRDNWRVIGHIEDRRENAPRRLR